MRIFNKFIESKKEPSNTNDIWFDGSVFRIYKEEEWQAFTVNLNDANEIAKLKDELYEFLYDEAKPTVEEAKQAAATIQEYVDKAIDALVLAQQSLVNSENAITEATALKSQTEQLIEQGNIVVENANKATDNANETSSNIKTIWDDLFVEINNSIASANEAADRANNSIVFYPISDEDVSIIMGNLPRTDSFVEEYTGHTYVYNNKYGLWYLTSDLSVCIAVPSIQSYNIEDEGRVFIQNINYIYNSETNRYERQGLYGKLPIRLLLDGFEEFGGQKEALFTNDGGHNILLKTKQQLADSEKNQVKENLGITDYDDAEIKQELTELSEEIEHQDILIEDLQESKADKDGVYSGMTVGRSIDLLGVEDVEEGSFLFRPTDGDGSIKDGVAVVKSVKGDSVVWNQHIKGIIESVAGLSISISDDNIISINGTATSAFANMFATDYGVGGDALKNAPLGKYVLDVKIINNPDNLSVNIFAFNSRISFPNTGNYTTSYQKIGDCSSLSVGGGFGISSYGGAGTVFNNVRFKVSLYNLTQMFGAGNEPSTIEEFNARMATLGVDMNAYNEGEVVNMKASAIKSVGFNAWDEEWDFNYINYSTGQPTIGHTGGRICSANFIRVIPFAPYYFLLGGNMSYYVHKYDSDYNWLGKPLIVDSGNTITFDANVAYIKFASSDKYGEGTTYNHDICINLVHSGYRNGEYEPYVEDVLALPTLDLFPNGMSKIGDVYDEYDSEKSVQRIGIRPYQSGDESIENVLTDGTSTIYVLEEPIVTPHDYRLAYKAWDFGTEQVIADGNTTAMTAGIIYEFNARDTIRSNKTRLDVLEPIVAGKIDKEADDYYPQLAVGLADNLAGVDVVDSEVNFRRSGGGAISDGVARIEAIRGNSVVWNQLYKPRKEELGTQVENGVTFIVSEDGIVQAEGTADGASAVCELCVYGDFKSSHKYILIAIGAPEGKWSRQGLYFSGNNLEHINTYTMIGSEGYIIFQPQGEGKRATLTLTAWAGYSLSCSFRPQFYDLTQMFGAGNEPTTIEEFYSRIPMGVDLNAYNEGEVIHMDVQSIESVGVNAWDEEWEIGNISGSNGRNVASDTLLRSKNYIPIIPSIKYYSTIHFGKGVFFYDDKKEFITRRYNLTSIPQNARYMRFVAPEDYGTTYKNDICINISDTSINGKYFPYIKRTEDLSIIRNYFPNGMKSAGSAHDEIRYNKETQKWEAVKRIGEVDMGTLTFSSYRSVFISSQISGMNVKLNTKVGLLARYSYCSTNLGATMLDNAEDKVYCTNGGAVGGGGILAISDSSYTDAASFKAAMSGVILYYELAEPIVTELDAEDQFKDLDYQVWNCGTEKAIAEGKSAPLAADITYGFNAIGKIKELEEAIKALQTKVASL